MEQLIIILLFVVASIVSSIIQKKKRDQEAAELERELRTPSTSQSQPTPPAPRPVTRWPRSAQEWQEQLRKMVEENAPTVIKPVIVPEKRETPPVNRPTARPIAVKVLPPLEQSEGDVVYKSPLRQSASAHERVANLRKSIRERVQAVDQQVVARKPVPATRSAPGHANAVVQNLRRKPAALRDAFIASLIFSPPKSLEMAEPESIR